MSDRCALQSGQTCQCPVPDSVLRELRSELYVKTGRKWARVTSGSMRPLIRSGDSVLIQSVEAERIRFGDVVAFERAGRTVVHRIVWTRRDRGSVVFIEKGDLNTSAGEVTADRILGRVTRIQRGDRILAILTGVGRALQFALALGGVLVAGTAWATSRVLSRLGILQRHNSEVGTAQEGTTRWPVP